MRLPENTPLYSMPQKMTKVFDADLRLAGIPKRDDQGRTVDVHALRHTFGTMLAKAGVPPQVAQRAMRHSDPKLAANVYTHLGLLDVAGAVAALPMFSDQKKVELPTAAEQTGRDSFPPCFPLTPDKTCTSAAIPGKTEVDKGQIET